MRELAIIVALMAAMIPFNGNAQGNDAPATISIDNLVNTSSSPSATSGGLVFKWSGNGLPDYETNNFSIQLYGGPNAGSLVPIVTLTGANQVISAGGGVFYDNTGGTYAVPGVRANGIATLELRAWEGNFATYNDAVVAGDPNVAEVTFQNPTGGGGTVPALPQDLVGMPALWMNEPPFGVWTVTPPQSQTNLAGTTATFTFTGYSDYGWAYQWQHGGTNLPNASGYGGGSTMPFTNAITLTIPNVSDLEAGTYTFTAQTQQPGDFYPLANATLAVIHPPTLALQFNGGQPQITLTGAANHNFLVQYSTGLTGANWVNLFSVTLQNSSLIQFTDPSGIGATARFYRAIMQ